MTTKYPLFELVGSGRRRLAMHRFGCHHDDHPRFGRRELLQAGGLGLLGVGSASDLDRSFLTT